MSNKNIQKYFDVSSIIVQAIGFIIIGILSIYFKVLVFEIVPFLIFIIFEILALFQALQNIGKISRKENISNLINFLVYISIAIVFFLFRKTIKYIFPFIFVIYALFECVVKIVIYYLYSKDDIKNREFLLLRAVISFTFATIILMVPIFREKIIYILIGIYFIIFGLTYFIDAINVILSKKNIIKMKRNFKFVLPVFLAAFIPRKVVKNINTFFESGIIKRRHMVEKENVSYDLEVLVHLGVNKKANFGHVDIFFDNMVLSYGSYDEDKVKLHSAIGDGVLFEVDKEKYLNFCNQDIKKVIVGFGIKLGKEEIENIRDKIDKIKKNTYEWFPNIIKDAKKEYKDYASRLYKSTGSKFYKFKKGKFKTYFVLNTNCVCLADEIIGKCGIDIVNMSGIITPGAYYDYFDREFGFKKSKIVSKTIYMWE